MRGAGFLLVLATAIPVGVPAAAVSLTLAQAEERAVAGSAPLRILDLRVRAASRGYALGVREFLPSMALSASSGEQVAFAAPDSSQIRWSVTLVQPVFDAGRSIAQRRLSALELAIGRREASVRRDELLDEVRQRFSRLLVARKQQGIQEEVLRSARQQLELARLEGRLGSLREVDVLETELEVVSVELELRETAASLQEEEFAFKRLVGLEADAELQLDGEVDAAYAGVELRAEPASLEQMAIAASQAMDRQRLAVRRSREQLRTAQNWLLPDVSLEVNLSLAGTRYPLTSPSATATLKVRFPWPALPLELSAARGGTPGRLSQASLAAGAPLLENPAAEVDAAYARAQWQSDELALADLGEQLRFQVTSGSAALQRRREALAVQRRRLDIEERTAAILARQVALGEALRIDYVRAETSLARSRVALLASVLALTEAERAFERLLGLPRGGLAALGAAAEAPAGAP